MALKQQFKTEEMVTNNTKMGWICDSNSENPKYNSKIPTATWPPLQYMKQQVLKFTLAGLSESFEVDGWVATAIPGIFYLTKCDP